MTSANKGSDAVISLMIQGMTCASCSKSVERVLHQVPGITDAVVDLEAERALIRGRFDPEAAIVSLKAAGFEASVADDGSDIVA